MADEVGSIVYEIGADVAGLVQGGNQAQKALDSLESAADSTVSEFKKLDTQVTKTGKAVGTALKSQVQQAGYQIQDFIVQVQGGQSALVAFSQQGSQLAGAFGPGGAVVGAIIALGSVIAGTLITSLNGGKNAMDALSEAADAMDKVITLSTNGVAALSDKYAALARTNAEAATILRNQALIEYNAAISKVPKAITDASDSIVSFGDKVISSLGGGYASVQGFNDRLAALNISTDSYSDAMKQAFSAGTAFNATAVSIGNTVGAVADKFGISEQQAFGFVKQLSAIIQNPTPEALQKLTLEMQNTKSSTESGATALVAFLGQLTNVVTTAADAKVRLTALRSEMDNLTDGQKNLIKQSERTLTLSKANREERAKLMAQYAAEDAGLSKDDPITTRLVNNAAAAYKNTQAQSDSEKATKKAATTAEEVAQKLAKMKAESELSAASTTELSRAQTILNAQQSLGKGATQEQIELAGKYAAQKWDTANALKAQAAAEKLLPEARENASYTQNVKDLQTAYAAQKITQQQYNQTSEQLEQQHQVALAKIRAHAVVSPTASAAGEVDPVQQLANQHAQQLALITQFEQQGVLQHQQALALKNSYDTQYEQQRIAAQWEIWSNQSTINQLAASAVESLGSGATSAITGLLNGTQSLSEAFANLGTAVLNGLVSSLVQMGTQWVMSALMGQAAQTTAIASNQAAMAASLATSTAAGAAAAATLLASWSPAAMAASVATSGGAAAAGLTGYTTAMTAAQTMSLAGMREHGGTVSANSMYKVGEGGKPEIFKASNGSQYMIPGDNGSVISNRDIGSSSSGSTIQQVNHFTIQSATGDPQDLANQIATISYQQSLRAMKDQQRPGGILRK